MSDSLVPEPSYSILDAVMHSVPDEGMARKVISNPTLASTIGPVGSSTADGLAVDKEAVSAASKVTLTAINDIGQATAEDILEAMHQVIDPELGINVVDLGLVYGIEIDGEGRCILTMTLTTPACPLTDLLEDETASVLAGLVEEFRIDWVWSPVWSMDMISDEGRDQLNAIGYNF